MSTQIAILAGGQSRRMGTDKSFVRLNGQPLLQQVIERVSVLRLPVVLIANDREKYREFGLPVIADVLPNAGSLGGIYTAVQHGDAEQTLCVACDMPFLNPALLRHLFDLAAGVDAVVPFVDGTAHALHAVYRRACLSVMRDQIVSGDLTIRRLFPQVMTRFVSADELRQHDPELRSLVNVNTPQELAQFGTAKPE